MIGPIELEDLPEIEQVIDLAVRKCVVDSARDADFLIGEIGESLTKWTNSRENSFHLKHQELGVVAGFIIVKEYWNLSHLFVRPSIQNRGVGRQLIQAALRNCRDRSPRGKIQLYSSNYAAAFYEKMGFLQMGPGKQEVGGCIPFEYRF